MEVGGELFIYHEKQVITATSLDGAHCLNTLLQIPLFTEGDLENIAQELKNQRRAFSQAYTKSTDFLDTAEEEVHHAPNSFQVLSHALSKHGLSCHTILRADCRDVLTDPSREEGLIANASGHWFTLRRIASYWFNFDSRKLQPQYLPPYYVGPFLNELVIKGHEVYVVRGDFPKIEKMGRSDTGRWLKAKPIIEYDYNYDGPKRTTKQPPGSGYIPIDENAAPAFVHYTNKVTPVLSPSKDSSLFQMPDLSLLVKTPPVQSPGGTAPAGQQPALANPASNPPTSNQTPSPSPPSDNTKSVYNVNTNRTESNVNTQQATQQQDDTYKNVITYLQKVQGQFGVIGELMNRMNKRLDNLQNNLSHAFIEQSTINSEFGH